MHKIFAAPFALLCLCSTSARGEKTEPDLENNLTYAVAWKQTAAEYRALYYQGFNIARQRVEQAISKREEYKKPLAIVSDVDDTLLLPNDYWGHLIQNGGDFFDDAVWDAWIPENRSIASPGSLAFLEFCEDNEIAIFYVTSRDQGEKTYDYALGNIRAAGFPLESEDHLTVLRETSNKQAIQDRIAKNYDIVVSLGDNLNDFRRKYYSKDIDERIGLMEEDHDKFGTEFVLFPNPTDGHWIRAIFGESEPPTSDESRAILKAAATRKAWRKPED